MIFFWIYAVLWILWSMNRSPDSVLKVRSLGGWISCHLTDRPRSFRKRCPKQTWLPIRTNFRKILEFLGKPSHRGNRFKCIYLYNLLFYIYIYTFSFYIRVVVSNIFYVHHYLGKGSNLTIIFFRWVETQPPTRYVYIDTCVCVFIWFI